MLGSIAPTPSSTKPVRVLVVEGQALFGKALCQLLSLDRSLQVVGDSETVSAADIKRARPNVILLDLDGHALDLDRAMALCREAAPEAHVCVLSMKSQPEVMQRTLAAGAQGYIIKDKRSFRAVAEGSVAYFDISA